MTRIYGLCTEGLNIASGINSKEPRFSWKFGSDENGVFQKEYSVTVTDSRGELCWDSGVRESRDTLVKYAGIELLPARDYRWTVNALMSNGERLSASAVFMTSLLDSSLTGKAQWIALPDPRSGDDKIPVFRRVIKTSSALRSAKLFCSGCGIYNVYLNGERVYGRDADGNTLRPELCPGYTEVSVRRAYHSYDITHMLCDKKTALCAVVTPGWWSDDMMFHYGKEQLFYALVILEYENGETEYIGTDEHWKVSCASPVLSASVWHGESYDARIPLDFMSADFDDSAWPFARIQNIEAKLKAHIGVSTVCRDDLCLDPTDVYIYGSVTGAAEDRFGKISDVRHPCRDFVLHKGETAVFDFTQNAAGREFFSIEAERGTKITVRHGEMLNDRDGLKSRGCDGPEGSVYTANLRRAKATTEYTACGEGIEEYRPLYTYYGFRLLSVTADADVHFYSVRKEVLTNVGSDSGNFDCGDKLVNRLFYNGRWGMYSNYLSVPTDCPQRDERLGWTADTQVFVTAAQYFSVDAQSFMEKYMTDMRDTQPENGAYYSIAPHGPYSDNGGSLGWADAGILIPYYVWRMSGDDSIIRENYESMKKYVDVFLASRGVQGPLPLYGDWLSFEPNDAEIQDFLAVCYGAWDTELMTKMTAAVGKDADARHFDAMHTAYREYFIKKYVKEDGGLTLERQTAALFALKLHLLPTDESYDAVKAQLIQNFERNGHRLQTGFLGTSILLPTLSEYGLYDLAYTLLLQDAMPSWLYSVKAGATTFWERWNSYSVENGFGDVGMNSFNHYAYGCVNEWLFSNAAGIKPVDGFRRFALEPEPDERLGYLRAEYESVCGGIRSEWKIEDGTVKYDCTVPANTEAELLIPSSGERVALTSGRHHFEWKYEQ